MSDTTTMIKALRVLSQDIQSGDGVANACVADAADMIESMSAELAKANEIISECWRLVGNDVDSKSTLPEYVNALNERVRELEAQTFDVIAAQSIEQAYKIANAFPKDKAILEALSAVKEGATNRLNKFAIEKKVEALEDVLQSYVPAKFHPTTYAIQAFNDGVSHLFAHIQERTEQLHKEQE